MATTIRHILHTAPLPSHLVSFDSLEGASAPSLSKKQWAQAYAAIPQDYIHYNYNPTYNAINAMFGPEDELDTLLLSARAYPLNQIPENFTKEGDSVRAFDAHVALAVLLAFRRGDYSLLTARSESGPLHPSSFEGTVDFTWGSGSRCVLLGELKRHGIINCRRWAGELGVDRNRRELGRELRAYCDKFHCAAGVVFDGKHLMILVFCADSQDKVRAADCPVRCLIFKHDNAMMLYGLYRTAAQQLRRCQALNSPAVTINGYTRRFGWFSGLPYWVDAQGQVHNSHPDNFYRLLDRGTGAWYWDSPNETLRTVDNELVWDTSRLW